MDQADVERTEAEMLQYIAELVSAHKIIQYHFDCTISCKFCGFDLCSIYNLQFPACEGRRSQKDPATK